MYNRRHEKPSSTADHETRPMVLLDDAQIWTYTTVARVYVTNDSLDNASSRKTTFFISGSVEKGRLFNDFDCISVIRERITVTRVAVTEESVSLVCQKGVWEGFYR